MVLATAVPKVKAATKLKNAAQRTATRGDKHAGGNHRGNGVRRIVKAIEKIKAERNNHNDNCKGDGRIHFGFETLDFRWRKRRGRCDKMA